mgnify:FL=1
MLTSALCPWTDMVLAEVPSSKRLVSEARQKESEGSKMKTYEEAKQWIENQEKFGIRPGLERVEWLLERLDHPERRLKSIHVGGTNGKGSVVQFLQEPMKEAGIVAGTFTSPYVTGFRERIAVNGEPISEEDFTECATIVRKEAEEMAKTSLGNATSFELLTVIAAYYFAKKVFPDIVIWEVGLGGRFDSTNVMYPMISVITNVGHDHQSILGQTLTEIAKEKAGIIKSGVPVVTAEENEEVLALFREIAKEKKATLYEWNDTFEVYDDSVSSSGATFSFRSILKRQDMEAIQLTMLGRHQVKNAATALMVLRYLTTYYAFPVEDDDIRAGFERALWPGRLEYRTGEVDVLLDGAHNREGIESLKAAIQETFPNRPLHFIIGMTKEKDPAALLAPLKELTVASCTAVPFDFERAKEAEAIAEKSPIADTKTATSWKKAWETLKQQAKEEDLVVFAGSLYFISEVRRSLSYF